MALTNFIPIVWNAQMLLDFRETAIAANLVNRQYEGDARSGNTVRVNTAGAVAIKDYKAGLISDGAAGTIPRTTKPDAVTSTKADLLIDQEKSFDFLIDDIDRAQAAGSLGEYTQSAAEGMAEDADKFIFAALSTTNAHLTAAAITTGDQAFDKRLHNRRKIREKQFCDIGCRNKVDERFRDLLREFAGHRKEEEHIA